MNKKADLFSVLGFIKWITIILIIALILYVIFIAVPNSTECESKCNRNNPYGQSLVNSDVPIFSNICHCYYSESTKTFNLRK